MKIVILLLFILSLEVSAGRGPTPEYDNAHVVEIESAEWLNEEVKSLGEQAIRIKIESAWRRAVETIDRTIDENTYTHSIFKDNRRFKNSQRVMKKAELKWGMHMPKWKMCGENTVAYVVQLNNMRHKVYICPSAYVQDEDILVQVFLHESAHMGGVTSECHASRMEVLALNFSDTTKGLKSGYWKKCHLQKFIDRLNH